ncbi:PilW family protein [Thermocrinis sp.]
MRKGMTLIELLIVVLITLILAGGIFYAYRTIVQQAITQSLVAKNEQDVETLLYQIRKDIATAGFGVPSNMLRAWANSSSSSCGAISAFANSNSTIGLATNCPISDELYFLSLATREFRNSGCWWIVDNAGNVRLQSRRWTLEDCPADPPDNQIICLDPATKAHIDPCNPSRPNTLIFATNRNPLNSFAVRYHLSDENLPRECAPGTFNLRKEISEDAPQPVASCVAVFRVRYYNGIQYAPNPPPNINNLVAVRVCMMIQVGGRTDTSIAPPNSFRECGTIASRLEWREYRWRLVEEDIPLNNIR